MEMLLGKKVVLMWSLSNEMEMGVQTLPLTSYIMPVFRSNRKFLQ